MNLFHMKKHYVHFNPCVGHCHYTSSELNICPIFCESGGISLSSIVYTTMKNSKPILKNEKHLLYYHLFRNIVYLYYKNKILEME